MGFFPVDEETCSYYKATGRSDVQVDLIRSYFKAQGMFGVPRKGECEYSTLLELDLASVQPSVSGPKRPQDRITLSDLKKTFVELLQKPAGETPRTPAAASRQPRLLPFPCTTLPAK